jgi:transposase
LLILTLARIFACIFMAEAGADIDYKKAYEEQVLLLESKETKIAALRQELTQLWRLIKTGKGERFVASQTPEASLTLFDVPQIEEITPVQVQVSAHTKTIRTKKAKHPGRDVFPESLRREEVVITPSGLDLAFAKKIGEDVSEILAYKPAELWVKRIVRPKYLELATGVIHQEKAPARGFERSKVDVSIPAQMIMSKYVDHVPLDRQLKIFSRLGLIISDSSVNNWINAAGYFLTPLYERQKELVLNSDYLHVDETTIRVMDSDKKGATHQGYYWSYQASADKLVLFEYQRGRGKEGPREMLRYFKGFLQTDGYHVYEEFGKREGVVLIHCMAHARRKFSEALGNDKARSEYVLHEMQRLYAIERHIREQALPPQEKLAYRQEHAKPILASLGQWMQQAIQEVLPSSLIGKALSYSLQRWERLSLYADHAQLNVDNNPIENSIRPIALGRKNYLFAGNDKAAQRAAMFYSLLATCKNHNVNPYDWLVDVLTRINDHPIKKIDELLPQNWKPLRP